MLVSLLFAFWFYLPWAVIGLMAALALRSRRESRTLLMQAAGATGLFILGCLQWVVVELILTETGASAAIRGGTTSVFTFLMFLALVVFAVGYCLERFATRKDASIQVATTPAE